MGSVHEVIEAFRTAPSNSERGTTFKKLMVRYFELDPTISQQYDAVWRWIPGSRHCGDSDRYDSGPPRPHAYRCR